MFKTITGIITVLAIAAGTSFATIPQQEEKIEKTTKPFMQRKLDASRDIVSGLAMEDFTLISKSGQDLMLLSHDADWKVITTPQYLQLSADFRGSAGRLRDAASAKNLDGSTLAYFEVTLNCVRCHKYIREDHTNKK